MEVTDLSSTGLRQNGQSVLTVTEVAAAVALGSCGVALMSGRATFAVVIVVGILAILVSPCFKRTVSWFWEGATTPLVITAGVVLAAWVPSTVLSEMPWVSVQVHVRMVLFVVFGVLVYAFFADRAAALNLLFKTMFISLAIGSVVAIAAILLKPGLTVLLTARTATETEQAVRAFKAAGSAAVVLTPLILWAGARLGGRWKPSGIALVAVLIVVTALTESRAGLAGLIAALGITLFAMILRPETRRWGGWLLMGLVAIVAAVGGYLVGRDVAMVLPEEALTFPSWLIDPHRQLIWSFSLKVASQHPWLGWGINTINLVPPVVEAQALHPAFPALPSHPHNWIIEVFAETGFVGGVPMVAAVVALFVVLLRRFRATGDLLFIALLAASAAFWGSSLFNFSFWSAWWQVLYSMVLAFLSAGRRNVVASGPQS